MQTLVQVAQSLPSDYSRHCADRWLQRRFLDRSAYAPTAAFALCLEAPVLNAHPAARSPRVHPSSRLLSLLDELLFDLFARVPPTAHSPPRRALSPRPAYTHGLFRIILYKNPGTYRPYPL